MWTWFTNTLVGALRPFQIPKHRLLSPLLPRAGFRTARVFGVKMDLDLADLIGRAIYLGTYEREETRLVRSVLRPGHTFVDVGANIGYYTALAAAIVGRAGRIISIEPSPICFARLSKLHRENSLRNCALLNAGVSDTNGTLTLYQPLEHAGNLNSTMTPQPNCTQVSVPVRKLDELLDELHVDAVDLLKIDIEGHEVRALRGAESALRAGRIRNILCEVNEFHLHSNGTSGREMMSFLADCGFAAPLLELPRVIPPPPGHSNFLLRRR